MNECSAAPQGDGAPVLTDAMVEAGAAVIEARKDTATQEELAALVYRAMAAAKLG
jgi:hypothetical protein